MSERIQHRHFLASEDQTLALGRALAKVITTPMVVHFEGALGAGKTTLVRAILRSLGAKGPIKSPTFTLVEPYHLKTMDIYHFDFYRLNEPDALEYLGIRDYVGDDQVCFIEWPDKGGELTPSADLICHLEQKGEGRQVVFDALTESGEEALNLLEGIV